MLYSMANGGNEPPYKPYADLMAAGRLVDAVLSPEERPYLGIRYSCFL